VLSDEKNRENFRQDAFGRWQALSISDSQTIPDYYSNFYMSCVETSSHYNHASCGILAYDSSTPNWDAMTALIQL